jgi:hypothetical protein
LLDTRALVIDVQDNTGGNSDVLFAALGRLLPQRTLFGRGLWLYFGPFTFQGPRYVEPREPCYHGELVVLTSAQTCSAAEWFARTLQREGRATIVGERTVGAEAGTRDVKGPDGSSLTFGWRWITDRDGRGLQDVGGDPAGGRLALDRAGARAGLRGGRRSGWWTRGSGVRSRWWRRERARNAAQDGRHALDATLGVARRGDGRLEI